jgi:hypothetical protein
MIEMYGRLSSKRRFSSCVIRRSDEKLESDKKRDDNETCY